MDPVELAIKMDGVKAWLDASAVALSQEQAAPTGKTALHCVSACTARLVGGVTPLVPLMAGT